ncbi:hypothetical protein GQR58_000509 [Nymphon striatum]|nr:hypothetical protein GQR58_000509 [Nymphon striatum]
MRQFLTDVNGFALGGGWYAVALGPFNRDDATARMRDLRRAGQIPRDSYVEDAARYRTRFWPVGAPAVGDIALAPVQNDPATTETAAPAPETQDTVVAEPAPVVDETPREARRSEAALTKDERKDLQVALKWAGFYSAAIDGSFGRGTRGSMANWQRENGYEPTGILTTLQRADLFTQYNAVLDGMGLELVTDPRVGIDMKIPMGVVEFDKYESPFAQFKSTTELGARVLLISQPGDADNIGVHADLARGRRRTPHPCSGRDAQKLCPHRRCSGTGLPAPGDEQAIDLVSGLEIRKPRLSRTGFYVSSGGAVLTTAEAVEQCSRITLDGDYEAEIMAVDAASGTALLRPKQSLSPMGVAQLRNDMPRLQSEIAISGFSYEGILGAPTMTFGKLADIRGLGGEEELRRLALNTLPGDAGAPVFDAGGAVVGLLLPRAASGRQLPDEVSFATGAEALEAMLSKAGIHPAQNQWRSRDGPRRSDGSGVNNDGIG